MVRWGVGNKRERARRSVVLLIVGALLATWLPGQQVSPAIAKDPPADTCQDRLLQGQAASKKDCPTAASEAAVSALALPTGFTESIVWNNLVHPTNIEFAADGRVFVAEKSGLIKVFESVSDPTPTTFSALPTNVHDFWDRGMLGLALDPSLVNPALPLRPWIYVLYTFDHVLGTQGPIGGFNDGCPTPPGPTTDGCVVSGRLSRFTVNGTTISGPEQVLVEDWCNQFPSHSVGNLGFGPDGALYVSGGDGASFNGVDYGQLGGTLGQPNPPTPKNPCGDPPGGAMTPPTAEGGALRSQDLRTDGAPTGNAYAATVLADNPAAYWRFGETSGTSAADSAGTNTGTYTGGFTLGQTGALTGDANPAVRLDGTSGYVGVPDSNALDFGNGPVTWELWVKRANAATGYQLVYTKFSQGNIYFLNNKLLLDDNKDFYIVRESGTTTDLNWHHFVITRTGPGPGNTKLYKDGVDVTTEINPNRNLSSNALDLNLGRYTANPGLYFNGSLDEVAVYPAALSAAQVQAHFTAATGP